MRNKFMYTGILAVALLFTGANADETVHHTEHEIHFSYDGETGPEYWGSLKEEWSTCDNGLDYTAVVDGSLHQSPVDFDAAVPATPSFALDYNKHVEFEMENNGHSIEFSVEEGSPKAHVTIEGKIYELKQFHFHSLSEHTEDEEHADMEGHFVNVAEDGSIAVIGIFIDSVSKRGNPVLNKAFRPEIPELKDEEEEEEENPTTLTLNPSRMLPGGKVYSYSGSLTTPPCSEGVAWNVYETHVGLEEAKVEAFQEHYDHNYRPVTGTY